MVGLIFVALSINLDALLPEPLLLRRAGSAIVLLLSVAVAMLVVLVPGQSPTVLGAELIAVATAASVVIGGLLATQLHSMDAAYRGHYRRALTWACTVQFMSAVSGISLIVGSGGGMYWLVPAAVIGLCQSILESWVLLVEIKR